MLHTLNYRSDWWNDDSAVPHTLNYGSDWWVIQRFDCTNVNTLWFQYVIQLSFDHWINYKWFIWTNFYCSDLSTHFSRDPFWSKIKLEALRPLGPPLLELPLQWTPLVSSTRASSRQVSFLSAWCVSFSSSELASLWRVHVGWCDTAAVTVLIRYDFGPSDMHAIQCTRGTILHYI